MIKFIGSKRLLVPRILELACELEGVRTVCDLFTGTTRVAQAFKRAGHVVHANDVTAYSHNLAQTYIETNATEFPTEAALEALARLNALPGAAGYYTKAFAQDASYFQKHNTERIDTIREAIDSEAPALRPVLLTALMLAADRVDSTTGLQMAYLKQWAPRSHNVMKLTLPELIPGAGIATCQDALTLAPEVEADLVYLDPPYNQHSYLGNYHIWETLIRNDRPESYGIANKRIDCRERKSPFNSRRHASSALAHVIGSLKSRFLILSFNDEGYVLRAELEDILGKWGNFRCEAVPFKRYVGAQIGIHNQKGVKVGRVGKLHNREFLFVARRHG